MKTAKMVVAVYNFTSNKWQLRMLDFIGINEKIEII